MNERWKGFARRWVLPFADPHRLGSFALLPKFLVELKRYRALTTDESVDWSDVYPCLSDRVGQTPFDPHYFYQGAWLARCLALTKPRFHVDIGSSVTMLSVLAAGTPIVFLDYRPLVTQIRGFRCVCGTATQLPFADNTISSLSSLHVIEHIGLGRYGDPLDPYGSKQAAAELVRVLEPGGHLFLSVPVGRERVCFNAHRVFAPRTILSCAQGVRLETFSLIDDAGRFQERVAIEAAADLEYGCGLFEFVKAGV